MKKSNKTFSILIGILILIFIALIFYVTRGTRQIKPFVLEPEDVLKEAINPENRISPIKVAKLIYEKDSNIVLVDIRYQYEYLKGHLPNAVNIYKADILDEENFTFFEELKAKNIKAILYGESVIEANIPFMILKQAGIENIVLMKCGYKFFRNSEIKILAEMGDLDLDDETAVVDFAKLINEEKAKSDNIIEMEKKNSAIKKTRASYKKKTVIIKKKTVSKPVEEEEEDEGC